MLNTIINAYIWNLCRNYTVIYLLAYFSCFYLPWMFCKSLII